MTRGVLRFLVLYVAPGSDDREGLIKIVVVDVIILRHDILQHILPGSIAWVAQAAASELPLDPWQVVDDSRVHSGQVGTSTAAAPGDQAYDLHASALSLHDHWTTAVALQSEAKYTASFPHRYLESTINSLPGKRPWLHHDNRHTSCSL